MYIHKLFQQIAEVFEDAGWREWVAALDFEASFMHHHEYYQTDHRHSLEGGEQIDLCNAWKPVPPEGMYLAGVFIDDDGDVFACFVKPRTELARTLWQVADVWSDEERDDDDRTDGNPWRRCLVRNIGGVMILTCTYAVVGILFFILATDAEVPTVEAAYTVGGWVMLGVSSVLLQLQRATEAEETDASTTPG